MKITLDLTDDQRDLLMTTLNESVIDHERQANRPGASQLAKRGHQSMRDDLEQIQTQIITSAMPTEDLTEEQVAS